MSLQKTTYAVELSIGEITRLILDLLEISHQLNLSDYLVTIVIVEAFDVLDFTTK